MSHPINEMPEADQIHLIEVEPHFIRAIAIQTPSLQWAALNISVRLIKYMTNPTEEMQVYAVNALPEIFGYIQNPCRAAKLAAIRNMQDALHLIYPLDQELIATSLIAHPRVITYVWRFLDRSDEMAAVYLMHHPLSPQIPNEILVRASEILDKHCPGLGDVYVIGVSIDMTEEQLIGSLAEHIARSTSPLAEATEP